MKSVTVLIAQPGSGAITDDVLRRVSLMRWLAEGEACEVSPGEGIERALEGLPIDIVTVPQANRRKRLLLADMDSTMIQQECIDELGEEAGVGAHIRDITARAMRGELNFESALRERVSLLKSLDETVITRIISDRITLMPGGKTLIATMRRDGAYTALVSGGFTAFTSAIAAQLGFDDNRANTLEIIDQKLTGEVIDPILGADAKLVALQEYTKQRGLSPDDSICVGDGANDLPMLKAAGLGVALHAKPHVQAQVQARINHGDLTALLYLQGYTRSEFA